MKRSTLIGIVVVVLVLVGAFIILSARSTDKSAGGSSKTPEPTVVNDNNMRMDNGSSSNNQVATTSVTIENFAFSPANITVKKGSTVTWTNKDSTAHTVTEDDGHDGPNSGTLASGKDYSFTYNTVGTFKYRCALHPDMTGMVTVTE